MNIYNSAGGLLASVVVDDNSYRNRAIMGDHNLTLYFSLAVHLEIPVGSYVEYQNVRYTLERPEALKMKHSRLFEYTVIFEAYQSCAKRWKFRNTVDGRLKFPLTATPREHLQMFVDNMNRRDSGWTVGACIVAEERLISYDHCYCIEALQQIAQEYETEFEIVGKTVSLHKIEYNKSTPLALSYGRGNGFKPNVGRSNSSDTMPVEILFVQGGDRNINPSEYGGRELLLPKGQTLTYEGRTYVASNDGLSIQRSDRALSSQSEDSLDCTDIYPKRVGIVGQVITVDAEKNFYDFTDRNSSADPCPNYEECLIEGETMTVIFQSGMLAGREFEVKYIHNAKTEKGVQKLGRRFEIVPQEEDGQTMPNATFKPAAGDTYVVYHCYMPQSYIRDDAHQAGASWDMFRAAAKYLYEHEEQRFTFTGELDGIWAKQDWENIGGKILLGGYVSFTDARFQSTSVLVRITGIKDYINNPHSPEITLSNETITSGFGSEFKKVQSEEVVIEDNYRRGEQFTKRRFRDAQETMRMLEQSLIEGFSDSISPIAAQMLQLLVGDESLQFRFVNSHTAANPTIVNPVFAFNGATGVFTVTGGYFLQHLTVGINTIQSSHDVSEYLWWSVQAYTSAVLDDPDKRYYLYLKCPTAGSVNCQYILSETAIKMEGVSGYYHFLVGVLNSEFEGERSFATLYGFTEITGGRITTDKIVSSDGQTYFNLLLGEIGGKITFKNGTSGLANISEWSSFYTGLQDELQHLQDQLDGVIETWYYSGEPTLNNLPASQWTTTTLKDEHIGDLYYDKATGKAYRFMNDSGTYKWVLLADSDIARALAAAAEAQDTADSKRRVFVAQPTNAQAYDVGDMWVNATYGNLYHNAILRCVTAKAAGATFSINHWTEAAAYTDDTTVNALIHALNDDDTFTLVEKRPVRDALKQICATEEDSVGGGFVVQSETPVIGDAWTVETDSSSLFYGWKKSNLHTDNKGCSVRVTIRALKAGDVTISIGSAAEGQYDYAVLGKLDVTDVITEAGVVDDSKVAVSSKSSQGTRITHTFANVSVGTHTFEVAYRKDVSQSTQPDNGYYKIEGDGIVADGTLKAAYDKCIAAGNITRANSLSTAANALFYYAYHTGSVWENEDTELADGVAFRNQLIAYFSALMKLLSTASEEIAEAKITAATTALEAAIQSGDEATLSAAVADIEAFGRTIISGGHIITNLIDTDELVAKNVFSKDGKFQILADGTMKAVNGEFSGKITATSGSIDGLQVQRLRNPFGKITDSFTPINEDNVVSDILGGSSGRYAYNLDWTTASSGRRQTIIGAVSITAPSGKYFYENGRKYTLFESSYECSEMIGYGTEDEFYGWIVVNRTSFSTNYNFGREITPLAFGKVTGTSSGASFAQCKFTNKDDAKVGTNKVMDITRVGEGCYWLYVPRSWFVSAGYIYADLCGYGYCYGGSSPIKATVTNIAATTLSGYNVWRIEISTSDDASENDGSFFFKLFNMAQWDD